MKETDVAATRGERFEIKNAIIESVQLDIGDRGFLQGWLMLDYGGTGQGFGGFVLCPYLDKGGWPSGPSQSITDANYAGVWLTRIMQVAGVAEWNQLKGKTIRVKCNHSRVEAIGHIIKDDWFSPSEMFNAMEKARG